VSSALLQSIASYLSSYLPLAASILWAVFLIILFFGGSIFVHEFGHFLAARRRGLRVERFSIGFGPKIFAWHGNDGVEYRLSWLFFGGYVLLPQLADVSLIEGESTTDVKKLPSATYGTKMLVFAAGAVFNVLFAFLLACIVSVVGQPTSAELNTTKIGVVLPTIMLPGGSETPSPAFEAGFKPGDIVQAIDGKTVTNWSDLQQTLYTSAGRAADGRPRAVFTVARDGQVMRLTVFPRLTGDERMRRIGIAPAEEFVIGAIKPGLLGQKIGLQPGDHIVAYDSLPLFSREAFVDHLNKHHARTVRLEVVRGAQHLTMEVPTRPQRADISDLGIQRQPSFMVVHPDPFSQITDNIVTTFRVLESLVNPRSDLGVSQLSGPLGIISVYVVAQSDIRFVLWFTILVNVNLAILNLLPIPVFDGGHMLFATIGRLRGRALPPEFIMTTQSVFVVLIISLFFYVSFFDVRRIVRDVRTDRAETRQPATPPAAAKPGPAPAAP
jgi:regulator of sigma E protease